MSRPRLVGRGRLLRGPNVHHETTVFFQELDPGDLAATRPTDAGFADFAARFVDRFAALPCPSPEDCLPRAARVALLSGRETTLVDALLEGVLAIERFVAGVMGRPDAPRFARVVSAGERVGLVWEAQAGWISRAAARAALAGLTGLLPPRLGGSEAPSGHFDRRVARLHRQAQRRQWAPAAAAVVRAARRRGLSHELLAGTYVRLGEGASQQMASAAAARHVGADPLLERLFPSGSRVSVPIALVAGDRGTRFVARALDLLLRSSREGVGLAMPDRTTIQGRPVDPTSVGRRKGAAVLLRDPRVETVVGAASARSIVARGLGVSHVEVAVFADAATGRHPSSFEAAARVVLAASTGLVVVHTDNPYAELVAGAVSSPERVVLVAAHPSNRLALAHAEAGGLVVQPAGPARRHLAELHRGGQPVAAKPIVWPRARPPARPGRRERGRALLAVGAAFALELVEAPAALPERGRTVNEDVSAKPGTRAPSPPVGSCP